MTDHQRARRARKSRLHFAKCAERAALAGNAREAERLLFWAQRKRALWRVCAAVNTLVWRAAA